MPKIANPHGKFALGSHHEFVVPRKAADQLLSRALAYYETGFTAKAMEAVIQLKDLLTDLHKRVVRDVIAQRQRKPL